MRGVVPHIRERDLYKLIFSNSFLYHNILSKVFFASLRRLLCFHILAVESGITSFIWNLVVIFVSMRYFVLFIGMNICVYFVLLFRVCLSFCNASLLALTWHN